MPIPALTRASIQEALEELLPQLNEIMAVAHASTKSDLVCRGHRYPPKVVIRKAVEIAYYVLFFLHLEIRRVTLAGITQHPTEAWMVQMARNAVDVIDGTLLSVRYALHDRDTKFCSSFQTMLRSGGVQPIVLPPRSPNLNAFAERCVRSIKHECLSKLILFGEASLRRTVTEFLRHYHFERNPSRQREHATLPCPRIATTTSESGYYLSRSVRRIAELLSVRRMNCLTIRGRSRLLERPFMMISVLEQC